MYVRERISSDMAEGTYFKRKRLQNSARSLNCTKWKSAFSWEVIAEEHELSLETSNFVSEFVYIIFAENLLQAGCLAVIKPISGCVHIACSGLMITSLLQIVNRPDAS